MGVDVQIKKLKKLILKNGKYEDLTNFVKHYQEYIEDSEVQTHLLSVATPNEQYEYLRDEIDNRLKSTSTYDDLILNVIKNADIYHISRMVEWSVLDEKWLEPIVERVIENGEGKYMYKVADEISRFYYRLGSDKQNKLILKLLNSAYKHDYKREL